MLLERLPIHIGNLRALPARLEAKDRELCVHSGTLTCEKMREYTVTIDEMHALGMNLQQVSMHAVCEAMLRYRVTVDEMHALGMNPQQAYTHGGALGRACTCVHV